MNMRKYRGRKHKRAVKHMAKYHIEGSVVYCGEWVYSIDIYNKKSNAVEHCLMCFSS